MAISEDERKFLAYWAVNREKESKLSHQIWMGLPYGIIFSLPVVVNFLLGRFWYKRADAVGLSQFNPFVLVLGIFMIVIFVAVFSRKMRWEKLEQQYREIMVKMNKEESAN